MSTVPQLDLGPDRYAGIGIDGKGRQVELVAVMSLADDGMIEWTVIHAQTPPKHDIRKRLEYGGKKKHG